MRLSRNVFAVPPELYERDLPPGYRCTLYAGRMVGKLGTYSDTKSLQQFGYEICDPLDPTEVVLRHFTYEAPAGELARWENVGDTVGIVIVNNDSRMELLLAYNFIRQKWFTTGRLSARAGS